MPLIILATAFNEFERPPEQKDIHEKIADRCLNIFRAPFGHIYQENLQESPSNCVTRIAHIAMGIIFILGAVVTVPITLFGIGVASYSTTYNQALARYYFVSQIQPDIEEQTIQEIFRHAVYWVPRNPLADLALTSLRPHFSQEIGKNLMEIMGPYCLIELARNSADKPFDEHRLSAMELAPHCRTLAQFQQFIEAIQDNETKMKSCIQALLDFFHDARNSAARETVFRQLFTYFAHLLKEEKLCAYIFEKDGLSQIPETRQLQLNQLLSIFPRGPIQERIVAENQKVS